MNSRIKPTLITAAAVGALALAGCGGSEPAEQSSVASTGDACQEIIESDSLSDLSRALDRYLEDLSAGNFDAELVQDAITRLETATDGAPARVKGPATQLMTDMQAYVDTFVEADSDAELPGTAALQEDVDEMNYICPS